MTKKIMDFKRKVQAVTGIIYLLNAILASLSVGYGHYGWATFNALCCYWMAKIYFDNWNPW